MEDGSSAFKILIGKRTGKRPLGRPRCRWEDNIRMDLEEIGNNAGNWVDSTQDRDYWRALVNAALIIFSYTNQRFHFYFLIFFKTKVSVVNEHMSNKRYLVAKVDKFTSEGKK